MARRRQLAVDGEVNWQVDGTAWDEDLVINLEKIVVALTLDSNFGHYFTNTMLLSSSLKCPAPFAVTPRKIPGGIGDASSKPKAAALIMGGCPTVLYGVKP